MNASTIPRAVFLCDDGAELLSSSSDWRTENNMNIIDVAGSEKTCTQYKDQTCLSHLQARRSTNWDILHSK